MMRCTVTVDEEAEAVDEEAPLEKEDATPWMRRRRRTVLKDSAAYTAHNGVITRSALLRPPPRRSIPIAPTFPLSLSPSPESSPPVSSSSATTPSCPTRIKSIAVFKYKMGDGAVDGSDCPVCLGEFQDDDRLRLLPTCRHAFHVACIDPWLKSNSNCPLCRASIVLSMDQERASDDDEAEIPITDNGQQHSVIPIADNHGWENQEIIRRSLSMNYVFHQSGRLSVADILRMDDDDHFPDSRLRHTLSLSRAKFLFPMLNRGRLATIPF
nr:E3 ubiquitin-protein ligase Os04g0590900-like [Ipomoea batatas]